MDGLVAENPKSPVLITGASGFVGSYLLRVLRKLGHPVTALSRQNSDSRAYEKISWKREEFGIHLAETNSLSAVEAEGEAGRKRAVELAEKLTKLRVRRWVYLSSAAVYGDESAHPHRETDPVSGGSAYAAQKLAVEQVFLSRGHAVVRSANLYGIGMSPLNVLSRLISQLPEARAENVLRVKSLEPVRDYLHVTDLAEGIAKILASDVAGIFNLSTGKGTSVEELCALVASAAGIESCRIEAEASDTKPSHLVLNPEKAQKELGWTAKTSLEQGLKDLVR